ncbi:MAG: DMT family transporter [Chloroflexi bacterium]|nr:DMT family transporter [Chloroflexota bacterium]
MLGIALAIGSALCWGTGALFARLGLGSIRASMGTLISMVASIVLVGSFALILNFNDLMHISPTALLWFSLIGVVNYFLGRQSNYTSIKHIGATKATALFASSPLFAMVLAVAFIGESVNPAIVTGTLIIVTGLYLVVTSK